MSDIPPPAPKRSVRAKTDLRGPEIAQALKAMGVTAAQFCRLTGTDQTRFKRQLKEEVADDLPLHYEIALFALYHHPELRNWHEPIPLPFDEWGIDIELVD